jgi:tetratricopeptide (TPR) repeat protein
MPSRLEAIQEMLLEDPHDPFLNYALALEYVNANNIEKATSIIEEIIQRDENYLAAYYQLGKLYEELNLKEKAIETYHKGIEIAKKQNSRKTLGELTEALLMLEDE